jgi:peptidoglycan/LPS O-acetylase OafA/YrhL
VGQPILARSQPYIPQLDGYRAIAALAVLLSHYGWLHLGWAGVQFFFVLSGFLITNLLVQAKSLPPRRYLLNFFGRRSLRIFPLYFGAVAALTVAVATFSAVGMSKDLPWLWTFTYNMVCLREPLQGNFAYFHFWTLCVEEQFYLLWSLLLLLFPLRGIRILLVTLVVAAPAYRFFGPTWWIDMGYPAENTQAYAGNLLFGQMDAFAIGGILAVFDLRKVFHRAKTLVLGSGSLLSAACIMHGLALHRSKATIPWSSLGLIQGGTDNLQHVWSFTLLNVLAGAILLGLMVGANENNPFSRLFRSKPLVLLGKISFGIYVFHLPLILVLQTLIGKSPSTALEILCFPIYLTAVIGLAWLSYRLWESPFLRLKDRFFAYN